MIFFKMVQPKNGMGALGRFAGVVWAVREVWGTCGPRGAPESPTFAFFGGTWARLNQRVANFGPKNYGTSFPFFKIHAVPTFRRDIHFSPLTMCCITNCVPPMWRQGQVATTV